MDPVRRYVSRVANALVGGNDTFDGTNDSYILSLSIVLIYLFAVMAFSVGAAVLSYRYNIDAGTGSTATVVYMILAFLFSYLYYPFYALVLTKNGSKNVRR